MSAVYGTLLSVRRTEERLAETAFADAQREVSHAHDALQQARSAREAWLDEYVDRAPAGDRADLGYLLTRMEQEEREATARLDTTRRGLECCRFALVEARRRRQSVEDLASAELRPVPHGCARRAPVEADPRAASGGKVHRPTQHGD